MLKLGTRLLPALPARRTSMVRYMATNTPFDLDESDPKYKELNTMYEEMFSGETVPYLSNDATDEVSEVDLLNEEIDSLYNVGMNNPRHIKINTSTELNKLIKGEGPFVLRSISHNPYFNLALEDYLFRNTPIDKNSKSFDSHRLVFYINNKCAVIGKNQNIWEELHLQKLKEKGYEVLRRLSGGGAVLHDLGNVNYSYICSRDEFDTKYFNGRIVSWLKQYNHALPVSLNQRGDILSNGFKISGSAYKVALGKAYHHGTMLIKSNLSDFKGLLKPDIIEGINWETNSVVSVRSPIENLPLPSPDTFIDLCTSQFNKMFHLNNNSYVCNESVMENNDDIKETMQKLQSNDWKYHSGPKFKVHIRDSKTGKEHSIAVEKGFIVDSTLKGVEAQDFNNFLHNVDKYITVNKSNIL